MTDLREKIRNTFNQFDGSNEKKLDEFYAADILFEDPVTRIQGLPSLKAYYAHAYKNVESIRFEFDDIFNEGLVYGAAWKMHLKVKGLNGGREYAVPGFSKLVFDKDGFVKSHRDYVDLGDMVYERLPIQGLILSGVKRLLRGTAPTI